MSGMREPSQSPSDRTRVRRLPGGGVYDRHTIYAVLDEALVCHIGIVAEQQPYVIPMLHARLGDRLYVHGSPASRLMQQLASGAPACITVTILDGLVLARSAFHHALNYRSVVILARGEEVRDRSAKWQILEGLVERVMPGRWNDARQPNDHELNGTSLVGFPLEEASAKIRTGPPKDNEADYALPVWAGVIPMALSCQPPRPDPLLAPGLEMPEYLRRYLQSA